MSRAVIDQAGFRIVFIGILLSLFLGFSLRTQIAPDRVKGRIQDAVARLDKDFLIDFTNAEVILSDWGLPLPSLQISNIRISPRKSSCQDSQIYIEKLSLPLSLQALITSESLVTQINASHVELRVADLQHCFNDEKLPKPNDTNPTAAVKSNDNHFSKPPLTSAQVASESNGQNGNLFQSRTAALLQKITIDDLKLISKKYPSQPVDFRHLVFEFGYEKNLLNKLDVSSQVYALKDVQSDIMYFKGDLGVQVVSKSADQVEAIVKLNGRLLDGEIQLFALVNSLEKNVKVDMKAQRVALKPLIQLNLVESSFLNFPMTFDFRGYAYYQYDTNQFTEIKINDIEVVGEKTKITLDELAAKSEKNKLEILPFKAQIQKLNLNKLVNLSQNKNVAQSIENFGEFTGYLNFKNQENMNIEGTWAGLEFIFANRGYRELQKLDSFNVQVKLSKGVAQATLSQFLINQKAMTGETELSYNLETGNILAKADIEGSLLNQNVWYLLTQVPQSPNLNVHWNYKKSKDERHQLSLVVDQVETNGLKFQKLDLNFIQTLQDGLSTSLVLGAKSGRVDIDAKDLNVNILQQIFNPSAVLDQNNYVAENLHVNFKGVNWRAMNFELDSQVKGHGEVNTAASMKVRGDWTENDFVNGQLALQSGNKVYRYPIVKTPNNELGISEP